MSGCIFKKTYLCDYCEARKLIEKQYDKGRDVSYKKDTKGHTLVFFHPKDKPIPELHQLRIKINHCTCED